MSASSLKHTSLNQHTGLWGTLPGPTAHPQPHWLPPSCSKAVLARGLCTRCCRSCLWLSWIPAHHHLLRRAGPRPTVLSSDYPPLQAPEGMSVLAPSCRQGGPETAPGSAPAPSPRPRARSSAGTRTCDWLGHDYLVLLGAVQSWEGPIVLANPKSAPCFQRGLRNSQTRPVSPGTQSRVPDSRPSHTRGCQHPVESCTHMCMHVCVCVWLLPALVTPGPRVTLQYKSLSWKAPSPLPCSLTPLKNPPTARKDTLGATSQDGTHA